MMNKVDNYFLSKSDKLSYIELKNKMSEYEKVGMIDIPLPIILDELMKGISNSDFQNEISMEYIINGILFNIAVDKDFRYISDYKDILKNTVKEPVKYSINLGIKHFETDIERSLIYFRAAFILDESDEFAAYNYARLLWNADCAKEDRSLFIEQSIRILERIIRHNENYPLAYFELGNINRAMGEWLKADSFYKKTLNHLEIEELREEVRNKINEIAPDVAVENAIYFINKMDYFRAIETLMDARKNSGRYDIPYYIAVAYMNRENPEMAEVFFEEAIDKGADFSTLYVDYTYTKYILGKDIEALQIANSALEKYPADIKLRYNRAIIYISLKKYDKANEDFNFILEYQDLSDELFNQIMIIKENLKEE